MRRLAHIVYSAGETGYLYEGMVSWLGSKEIGLGPSGTALRTGVSQMVHELVTDAFFEPWRERAAQYGFGSSVAIPATAECSSAVLSIYARDTFAFDEVTVSRARGHRAVRPNSPSPTCEQSGRPKRH